MPSTHDIFISYKSENVTAVRAVVDCLIAGDIDVWFDEYRILLHNCDNDKFQTRSIAASTRAATPSYSPTTHGPIRATASGK